MAFQDPFDRVLTKLGIYQRIQDMSSIPTVAGLVTTINILKVPCRIQGKAFHWPNVPDKVRFYSHSPSSPLSNLELLGLPAHMQCLIYACWSAEFGRYFTCDHFTRYVRDKPVRFALQATGAVVSTAAVLTVPILSAVGFSPIGPVAGSVAAGWQASIGAVEAGSLFSVLQSIAMGGAAATGLATIGASGAAVTLAASGLPSPSNLKETFIRTFRKGPEN